MMDIPEKTFFKIGEVAKLLDVEAYVLRYWESEFDMLVPEKTKSGQRIYQREDIVLLSKIRDLLYVDMYTIVGARRQLELGLSESSDKSLSSQSREDGNIHQDALIALQSEHATLQDGYDALQARYVELQEVHQANDVEARAVAAQMKLDYELICDERDVLAAQLEVLQQENEALHLAVVPDNSVAELDEKNSELFEVIGQLELELREAHRVSDELREFRNEQLSQEEQRRRNTLQAMRLELEGLINLANGVALN